MSVRQLDVEISRAEILLIEGSFPRILTLPAHKYKGFGSSEKGKYLDWSLKTVILFVRLYLVGQWSSGMFVTGRLNFKMLARIHGIHSLEKVRQNATIQFISPV